jgi:hypothetical protein
VAVTAAAGESIEGSSYAMLFSPATDPVKTVWTNPHNGSFTQYVFSAGKLFSNHLHLS